MAEQAGPQPQTCIVNLPSTTSGGDALHQQMLSQFGTLSSGLSQSINNLQDDIKAFTSLASNATIYQFTIMSTMRTNMMIIMILVKGLQIPQTPALLTICQLLLNLNLVMTHPTTKMTNVPSIPRNMIICQLRN